MTTTTIPRRKKVDNAASTEIAEIARQALIHDDCTYYMEEVRHLPQNDRDQWLQGLAEHVARMVNAAPCSGRYWNYILHSCCAGGWHINQYDLFVLIVRLGRAGYITRSEFDG